jgi:hypothetical protein
MDLISNPWRATAVVVTHKLQMSKINGIALWIKQMEHETNGSSPWRAEVNNM